MNIEEKRKKDRDRKNKSRRELMKDPKKRKVWNAYKKNYYYNGARRVIIRKGRTIDGQKFITYSAFELLEKYQDYKCAICGEGETTAIKGNIRRLSIDHDHKCCDGFIGCSKCIRGLLCGRCNRALGLMKDDVALFTRAIEYLSSGGTGDIHILERLGMLRA